MTRNWTGAYQAHWADAADVRRERRVLLRLLQRDREPADAEQLLAAFAAPDRDTQRRLAVVYRAGTPVACVAIDVVAPVGDRNNEIPVAAFLRIDAWSVHPRHRAASYFLLTRLAAIWREHPDLRVCRLRVAPEAARALLQHSRVRAWRRLGIRPESDACSANEGREVVFGVDPRGPERRGSAGSRGLDLAHRFSTAHGPVAVGVVRSRHGWDDLRPAWDELLADTADATVFQSFDCLRAWWNHVGWGNELFIVVVRRDTRVVGILPMQIDRRIWLGAEMRVLTFLGYAPESDRPRLLSRPGESAVASIVAEYLLSLAGLWQEIWLPEQSDDDVLCRELAVSRRSPRRHLTRGVPTICPRAILGDGWPVYLASRSRALRKNLKRRIRGLEALGNLHCRTVEDPEELRGALERYLEVERRSWKRDTSVAIGRSPENIALYHDLLDRFGAARAVTVRLLELNGRPIAATIALRWHGNVYSLQIAHDRDFDRHSPGLVLTGLELELEAQRVPPPLYDFLSGTLENKLPWANDRVMTRDFRIIVAGPVSSTFHLVYFRAKPGLRWMLDRLRVMQKWTHFKARILGRHYKDADGDD